MISYAILASIVAVVALMGLSAYRREHR